MAIVEAPPVGESEVGELWEDAPGLPGFFSTVDHKRIGMRYIYTCFFFFFVAGLMALGMRAQLATPNAKVLGPELYNELFTMHGVTMIFLFNTPVLAGFGNYLIPLQIGTRDMAFPRLNAFSYWVFLLGGIFMYSSFLFGMPDGGWFGYVPLVSKTFSPGLNIDFWGLGIVFTGLSTTVGSINFIVTIFKLRAPGMSLNRMPIFVWSMLVFSFMAIFAVPAVTLATGLNELDRLFGTAFFVPALGGSVLLYQHLFWFWGHPEVYILFVPATGMISQIVPTFSGRPLAGYLWVAGSLVTVGFISFGVWVHHMFATGMPAVAMAFFSGVSLIITLPSGVQFFAWIATMWKGRVRLTTPMLFAIGFLLIFLLGGITGVMVAVLPFDWQVTDSYFVVAHFHYVLNGAVVFPIFGAIYYWMPKMTGRMLSEKLGKLSFWVMFVGFNITFFPMHILGFLGMPRRIYTYDNGLGWGGLNAMVSIGSAIFGLGTAITLFNWVWSRRKGEVVGDDPWDADSLEWSTTSPPPHYNFAAIPLVASRHPLWDQRPLPFAESGDEPDTSGLGIQGAVDRETPVTSGIDTRPEGNLEIPHETYLPFVLALGIAVLFVGLLIQAIVVGVAGVALAMMATLWWAWRTEEDLPPPEIEPEAPVGSAAGEVTTTTAGPGEVTE
ncbi:MAG TPA: cytochrome c oxidase subunit I [Acidimicrobiales bacterium]|nr:cytochrome c oxidase subunit I [Acidimicrobiales bacterium]